MDRAFLRKLRVADADRVLEFLSTRQYVAPHQTLRAVLTRAEAELGLCPGASTRALAWLGIDENIAVGRLLRTELVQLARSLHRFWRQNAAAAHATA